MTQVQITPKELPKSKGSFTKQYPIQRGDITILTVNKLFKEDIIGLTHTKIQLQYSCSASEEPNG